jgi:hypothetical protein
MQLVPSFTQVEGPKEIERDMEWKYETRLRESNFKHFMNLCSTTAHHSEQ